MLAARKLLKEPSKLSIRAAQWIDYEWDLKYSDGHSELRLFVPKPTVLAWICRDLLENDATTFALMLENVSHPYTNGSLLLEQSVNVMH